MFRPDYPVVVLSLPGDEVRRQPLISALEAMGIAHEIFFGVDGRIGFPADCEQLIDRKLTLIRNRRSFSDAEYACALSHQAIYAEIIRRDLPGAVVLEDDAVLADGFKQFLLEGAFRKAEMVLLGHHRTYVRRSTPREVISGVQGHRIAVPPLGAYGYSLSVRAAHLIRKRSFPISKAADWPCDISRMDVVALMPQLVIPDRRASHLQAERHPSIRNIRTPHLELLRRIVILDDWSRLLGRISGVRLD
ncbi:glycosyltransferase family 25 protein [Pararhodobacter sp. SW119]|uniref:glycosyltransferase family 25 protein n=1 Tax=Pararhodobacter sp. SW119 TaxID=2780075 RepID=UPI001ADFCD0F|nr:glycosyltransferase family 25 protein [Pararhodobacter sp. SW119]